LFVRKAGNTSSIPPLFFLDCEKFHSKIRTPLLLEQVLTDIVIDFSFSDEIENNLQYLNILVAYGSDWNADFLMATIVLYLKLLYFSGIKMFMVKYLY
ncbi:MAG: hypothetical protein K2N90_01685, partial [Lachnospiraceae bacterium]|nr:hypothetical protein [Lachnospiraceae bacterium]